LPPAIRNREHVGAPYTLWFKPSVLPPLRPRISGFAYSSVGEALIGPDIDALFTGERPRGRRAFSGSLHGPCLFHPEWTALQIKDLGIPTTANADLLVYDGNVVLGDVSPALNAAQQAAGVVEHIDGTAITDLYLCHHISKRCS
jgi:hypothetical protein